MIARRVSDERGIITGTLVRYVAVLVILGIVAIEAGSIIFTYIRLQNAADAAAVVAADVLDRTGDRRAAEAAARAELAAKDQEAATITSFEATGRPEAEVRFTAEREAPTLVVGRIGFLQDLGRVEVDASARPVAPGV